MSVLFGALSGSSGFHKSVLPTDDLEAIGYHPVRNAPSEMND